MTRVRYLTDPILGAMGKVQEFDRADCRTLADIIARVPLANERHRHMLRVKIAGELITDPSYYHRIIPKVNAPLAVVLPLHGGDNNLFLTIAAVALIGASIFVSAGLAAPLLGTAFASGTVGANLLAAGLSFSATLLLQGLAAPKASTKQDSEEIGVATAQNAFEPGGPLPRVMGTRRLAPPMAMPPYTEVDGKNQWVNVVYALGGAHKIEDIRIGGSSIDSANDIEYEVREGFASDLPLTLVTKTVIEKNVNLTLSEFKTVTEGNDGAFIDTSTPDYVPVWHRIETGKGPDDVKLMFGLPQGLADLVDANGAAVVAMRFRIRKKGSVTWVNLPEFKLKARAAGIPVRFWMDIHFVPLGSMPASHTNFPALSYSDKTRGWYNRCDRWPVSGTLVWAASTYFTTTQTHAINYVDGQQIEVFLDTTTFPQDAPYEIELIRGFPGLHSISNGWYATDQTYEESGLGFYTDMFSTKLSGGNPKIPRDPDKAPSTIVLTAVQSIWNEYPFDLDGHPCTLIALRARNRDVSQLTCKASGYVPKWNGTTWVADQVSSNPADWYRHVLLDDANARPAPSSLVALTRLQEWWQWCLDNGFEVNAIGQGESVDDQLSTIAQAGFARRLYGAQYSVVIDKPRETAGTISMRNASGFSFQKPFGELPHALKIQLTDRNEDYAVREIIAYAPGYAAVAGGGLAEATRFEVMSYAGIDQEAHALARGERDLAFAYYRAMLNMFTLDFENFEYEIGSRVWLKHDILGPKGSAGRVVGLSIEGGNIVAMTLDDARDFSATDAASLDRGALVRLADGTMLLKQVTTDDSDPFVIRFTVPFPQPVPSIAGGELVLTGSLQEVARDVIIWDMQPGQDHTCQVVAIDYAEREIYGDVRRWADTAHLQLDGQEVGLSFAYGLPVTPAAISLVGQNVLPGYDFALPVVPAAVEMVGQNVGQVAGYVMPVVPAAVEIDGQDVVMKVPAFPKIEGTPVATAHTSSSTDRNIDIPAGVVAGELLLAILTTSNGSAVTLTPPTGWSNVSGAASSNTNTNQAAFWKIADGSEGGATVTAANSAAVTNSAAVCYRISGHDPATPPEAANANTASSANPDPPNLAPSWGLDETKFIAAFGRRSTACSVNAYPAGYGSDQVGIDAGNCKTFAATKEAFATSDNPGTFTLSNSAQWNALTIAIKPAP